MTEPMLRDPVAPFDRETADDFAARLTETYNAAALTLMISIGHRAGLFDALADLPAATSGQVAARAGKHERYVREWLGAMVTGRVVEYDPRTETYRLPRHRAGLLTRAGSPDNLAVLAQFIPLLGGVEDDVLACFEKGGGVPYARFERFHEVMAEDSDQTVVASLERDIIPLVPGLADRLRDGIDVLDVGCGRGHALLRLAATYPASRFLGIDLGRDAIAHALARAADRRLANVSFEVRDAADPGEGRRFDLITAFDAIHDQRDPAAVLEGIARALRSGGTFLMQDIHASSRLERNLAHPIGTLLYTISCMHCMTVSLAQGGAGLGTCWGVERAEEMLRAAGFREIRTARFDHDIQNQWFVCGR